MHSTEGFRHIAKNRFKVYLEQKGYRKTLERFAILDELYQLDEHIDVDGLFLIMRNKKYSISRATIYNTLDLLVECDLAVKHNFQDKNSLFEQSLIYQHHDHLVCSDCNRIKEFIEPTIDEIKKRVGKELQTDIKSHALVFYGNCTIPNCEYKKK